MNHIFFGTGLLVFLWVGCSPREAPTHSAASSEYEIRDTTEYVNVLTEGRYALLERGGAVLDSIDLYFGLHHLNNGAVVFLPVVPAPSEELPHGMDAGEYVAFDGRHRVRLNTFLPHFLDYFSSPGVVDGVLYYWGLERLGDASYRIHAVRYDAAADQVESRFLVETEVATDDRAYFTAPYPEGDTIVFEAPSNRFLLDPDLQTVRRAPPAE